MVPSETCGSFRGDFGVTLGIEMGQWKGRKGQQGCRADRRGRTKSPGKEGALGPSGGEDTPTGALVFSIGFSCLASPRGAEDLHPGAPICCPPEDHRDLGWVGWPSWQAQRGDGFGEGRKTARF